MSEQKERELYQFSQDTLHMVLGKMLDCKVSSSTYKSTELQGGTVADVRLIEGTANDNVPFKIVLKVQNKWERFADVDSWKREYDFYSSDFEDLFDESFKWPTCYHSESSDNRTIIWMEYADGVTGKDFTVEMYAKAAEALGRFQGKLYKEEPKQLSNLKNLSTKTFIKDTFFRYARWDEANTFIRDENCPLPKHIQNMLLHLIDHGDEYWTKIEQLPIVLSQRDYWFTNIFYKDGNITCIDWDTTGWGHLGEDMASLIADEIMPDMIPKLYKECVPAYYKGFMEYIPDFDMELDSIYELILTTFSLRIMADYMYSKTKKGKEINKDILDAIYHLKEKSNE